MNFREVGLSGITLEVWLREVSEQNCLELEKEGRLVKLRSHHKILNKNVQDDPTLLKPQKMQPTYGPYGMVNNHRIVDQPVQFE